MIESLADNLEQEPTQYVMICNPREVHPDRARPIENYTWLEQDDSYVIMSEPFTLEHIVWKKHEEQVKEAVETLNRKIEEIRADAGKKIKELEDARDNLLALTHQVVEDE